MCKAVETISLSNFMSFGELGSIKTGMSLKQFYNIMGKPDDISLTRLPIWKYGTVEFGFSNAKDSPILDFIGIYFQNHNNIVQIVWIIAKARKLFVEIRTLCWYIYIKSRFACQAVS